ncbi:MAG: 50S ribosomal protein L25 [Patescibacteria group bacterium]|jgi:large subunit ribosomal protein L25
MTNLNLSLKAKTRKETGKQVNQLRKQGEIPAVLYGHKIKPLNLTLDYSTFEKIFTEAGESTLIDLTIDDQKPVKVLVQDYQLDPKTNQIIHTDFHQVRMDEKLHAEIALNFINEPPAVKELSGILVTTIDSLEVECLPQDLVHEINVDLSVLKTFEDVIHIADIKIPSGLTITNNPHDVVALIQQPRTDKELEGLEVKPKEPEVAAEAETEETTPADKKAEGKEK